MKTKSNPTALYIHIPFCKNICAYCDFAKVIYQTQFVNDYFKSLFFELEHLKTNKYKTIYIGGGTPSCIPLPILETLFSKLQSKLSKNYEFTFECNVEDIDLSLLTLLKKYGVNRLSVGIQTFQDKWIQLCNRKHTKESAISNILLASQYIYNLNVDMIYALPFQKVEDVQKDLDILMMLPLKHISYYSLIIEKNTVFYHKYEDLDDAIQAQMYTMIYKTLKKYGFKRYEFSNFAKKGFESKHNQIYWKNMHYDAIGLQASGYVDSTRYTNTRNLSFYNQKKYQKEITHLSKEDQMFEEIMLRFRLDKGLSLKTFYDKFKVNFLDEYSNILKELEEKKWIKVSKTHVHTTFQGSLLMNQILQYFLQE